MVRIDGLPGIQIGDEMRSIIGKAAEAALLMEKCEGCEVSIFVVDDAEIHRLNKLYRDVDRPTDVLAFAMREGIDSDLNRDVLGDVVVSLTRAEQQARLYGHDLGLEMSLLVSHGVLHLLGYDHEKRDDLSLMQRKQREVLGSLGYDVTAQAFGKGLSMEEPASDIEGQVIKA